ncbi:MAG: LD-carboxypeptidase [Fidelibacterota bacterium]
MEIMKPKAIHKGDTIGVVCPSKWAPEDQVYAVKQLFEEQGYRVVLGKTPFLRENQYAGTPEERARDIEAMFANPEIDAIVCARGGYGANRVIPLLNYDLIRDNPKIFMGYSDITALIHSIRQRSGFITFHGPMFVTYKNGFISYNWNIWEAVISGKAPLRMENPHELKPHILKPGSAEGMLSGGNLTLINNRLGTPEQIDFRDTILFLEDIDEYLYAFDRYLVHLRQSGTVESIRALIVGELVDMKDDSIPFGKSTDEIIMDVFGDLNIPIVSNVACGHGAYQMTLPVILPAELSVTSDSFVLTLPQAAVRP